MKDPIKAMHMYICINLNWGLLGYRFLLSHGVFVEMYDCIVNYALNLKSMSIYEFIFRISQSYSQFDWLWWAGRRQTATEDFVALASSKGSLYYSQTRNQTVGPDNLSVCVCSHVKYGEYFVTIMSVDLTVYTHTQEGATITATGRLRIKQTYVHENIFIRTFTPLLSWRTMCYWTLTAASRIDAAILKHECQSFVLLKREGKRNTYHKYSKSWSDS